MRLHMKGHYPTHKCDRCNERFAYHFQLKQHYNKVHSDVMHFHTCLDCDGFQYHPKYLDSNPTQLIFPCPKENCLQYFLSLTSLIKHFHYRHTKQRFECDMCGKGFWHRFRIKQHLQAHMSQPKLRSNFNILLPENGLGNDNLEIHSIKAHSCKHCCDFQHKIIRWRCKEITNIFSCGEKNCSMLFFNKSQLLRHFHLRHTPNFGLECDLCGKLIRTKNALKRHLNLHMLKKANYNLSPNPDSNNPSELVSEEALERDALTVEYETPSDEITIEKKSDIFKTLDGNEVKRLREQLMNYKQAIATYEPTKINSEDPVAFVPIKQEPLDLEKQSACNDPTLIDNALHATCFSSTNPNTAEELLDLSTSIKREPIDVETQLSVPYHEITIEDKSKVFEIENYDKASHLLQQWEKYKE